MAKGALAVEAWAEDASKVEEAEMHRLAEIQAQRGADGLANAERTNRREQAVRLLAQQGKQPRPHAGPRQSESTPAALPRTPASRVPASPAAAAPSQLPVARNSSLLSLARRNPPETPPSADAGAPSQPSQLPAAGRQAQSRRSSPLATHAPITVRNLIPRDRPDEPRPSLGGSVGAASVVTPGGWAAPSPALGLPTELAEVSVSSVSCVSVSLGEGSSAAGRGPARGVSPGIPPGIGSRGRSPARRVEAREERRAAAHTAVANAAQVAAELASATSALLKADAPDADGAHTPNAVGSVDDMQTPDGSDANEEALVRAATAAAESKAAADAEARAQRERQRSQRPPRGMSSLVWEAMRKAQDEVTSSLAGDAGSVADVAEVEMERGEAHADT